MVCAICLVLNFLLLVNKHCIVFVQKIYDNTKNSLWYCLWYDFIKVLFIAMHYPFFVALCQRGKNLPELSSLIYSYSSIIQENVKLYRKNFACKISNILLPFVTFRNNPFINIFEVLIDFITRNQICRFFIRVYFISHIIIFSRSKNG